MRQILKDFYRAHISLLIRYTVIVAICITAFLITGVFARDNTRIPGIVITAFLGCCLIWAAADIFIVAPKKFRDKLGEIPEGSAAEVVENYSQTYRIGVHKFYKENWIIFYSYRRIKLMRYDERRSADLRRNGIFLKLCDGKETIITLSPGESGEMLMAAIKGRNGNIKIMLNGEPAHFASEPDGEEKDGKEN